MQLPLPLPIEQDMAPLPAPHSWQTMNKEYYALGLYPNGHIMAAIRPYLDRRVLTSEQVADVSEGIEVTVAGWVIRRQRPLGRAVYMTLEDEFGHIPLVVWPGVYEQLRTVLRESLLEVRGSVSRQEGTMNIVVKQAQRIPGPRELPQAKDWH
jgi:error-prone DNA polymerase